MASKTESLTGLEAKARAVAEQMGYELVDVCMDKEPTGKYLRFYIDKEEGVSLDDCEAFHKAVRTPADSVDYDFMEVSSPGIDRPLKKDRDFERNLGAEVEVHLFRPLDGTKELRGILAGLPTDDGILWCCTECNDKADIDRLVDLKRDIMQVVKTVDDPELQTLLELRYLCFKDWQDIAYSMHCTESNVFKVHSKALQAVKLPKLGSEFQ